uniref:Beta-defensin-like domain-containing protein n=1 Tax=Salvator merianae TaxID=96440 RepID=A0A8D0BFG3_SALMN
TILSMKTLFLISAVLLLLFPAAPEPDTVTCKKNDNICATLLCPFWYKTIGTCYEGRQKCCRHWINGQHSDKCTSIIVSTK